MPETIPHDGYVLIIGAMKCGTSSLYEYLKNHPQLCPALTKEPEFFSRHQRHGLRLESYSDLWEFDPRIHRYALEASSGYTKFPAETGVPQRIYGCGIRPKFIYVIRNPFDRIVSHYNYMLRDVDFNSTIIDDHLINTSNYYLQLAQYHRLFPRADFLVLDFDELKATPERSVEKVCRFLDIDETYRPQSFAAANKTRVQSSLERVIKRSPLGRAALRLPASVRQSAQRVLASMSPRRQRVLAPSEYEYVMVQLTPDMQKFEQEYGFDIGRWGFESATVSGAPRDSALGASS